MSDERVDLLENTSPETTKEVDMGKDWELAIEALNATMLEETPKLTDLIRQHYIDLGNRYSEILEQAAASGEEKKLRSFMRREMKSSYRKDIEVGRKLVEWTQKLDRPEDIEDTLYTIFSEVGLGVGFGLLSKLPDTYNKPNVRATDTERRRQVAIAILDELVEDVTEANETDPKNDLVVARVSNLIKTYTLPEVGDRVEFDKTMRGVVVEHVDEEIVSEGDALSNVMDAVIVRIDNSGEEKTLLRGEKKFTEEPIARLHEAAIVRGDHQALYGHTVVVQNYEPGDSELVEVLCLDGTSEKIPAKDLVRAKPKDAKVVGDLLHLVSEKGHLDKIKLAVEHAEKPLLQELDKLRATAEASYEAGQIFAVSRPEEIEPEVFVGAFTAMPSDKQAIVLSQIVPTKPALPPLDADRMIEIQGGRSSARASLTDTEIKEEGVIAGHTLDFSTPQTTETTPEQEPVTKLLPEPTSKVIEAQPIEVQAVAMTERTSAVAMTERTSVETEQPIEIPVEIQSEPVPENTEIEVEPSASVEITSVAVEVAQVFELELPLDLIEASEKHLLHCFNDYFAKRESALPTVGASAHSIFSKVINEEPGVKEFLSHSVGKYFLMAIATGPWGNIRSDITTWCISNPDVVRDRIDTATDEGLQTETELFNAINLFKDGNKEALKSIGDRIKKAAQATLTKKEKAAMLKKTKAVEAVAKGNDKPSTTPEASAVHPVVRASANINEIRDWLLTSTFFETAIGLIKGYELKIEEIISSEELQIFAKQSQEKANHVAQILKTLDSEDYLNTPLSSEIKVDIASDLVVEESSNNQNEEISW